MIADTTAWRRIEGHLRSAMDHLTDLVRQYRLDTGTDLNSLLSEAKEYLEHNELELAWEAIAEAADQVICPPITWEMLTKAAEEMELDKDAAKSGRRANIARVIDAFLQVRHGASTDLVIADPKLNRAFRQRCRALGAQGTDFELNWTLMNARKHNKLPGLTNTTEYTIPRDVRDEFEYASEMAIRFVQIQHPDTSVDKMMCDPALAATFDDAAKRLAPGFTPREYRWAALGLRKKGKSRVPERRDIKPPKFARVGTAGSIDPNQLHQIPGVYLFESERKPLFVGETENLRHRYERHLAAAPNGIPDWLYQNGAVDLSISELPGSSYSLRKSLELSAIQRLRPLLNYLA